MNRSVKIVEPGMYTTVQDRGRTGYLRYGLPPSGPMDRRAFEAANLYLGNDPNAAMLEVTGTMPVLEFYNATRVAVVYADDFQCLEAGNGERLSFEPMKKGYRAYIALEGGIDVPLVMGSRSTYVPGKLGGLEGRALRAGDVLPLANVDEASSLVAHEPSRCNEAGREARLSERKQGQGGVETLAYDTPIRVIPGPEAEWFDCGGLNAFLTESFAISAKSDRTGIRLEGTPISFRSDAQMVSAGISFGTIQVPPSGQPIIMMADHPTTGGYPRIGHVISADLPVIAQLRSGEAIRFSELR